MCKNACRVKAVDGWHLGGDVFSRWQGLEKLLKLPEVLGGLETARRTGGYARIAARSGWMPMMFMTRVRL